MQTLIAAVAVVVAVAALAVLAAALRQLASAQDKISILEQEYQELLESIEREREEAVRQSQSAISGKVMEQVAPYLPDFPFDPRDMRFIGSPIDYIVFDGLSSGNLQRIVLVEVKSGKSKLTQRQRQVRDVLQDGAVSWHEVWINCE